ncbi:lanthionine synthetase C family protein [Bacillus sp. FJAT-49705]|uniref:Lanthionine synthetase C family protein n=1 Tax=Cytobacillus citreus TaxID=2833586 RepID=A0ABS5NYE0_9BACI|nr:lanthionine synthetase C family protein [Cytobacillus citreus]MBS4192865.1 lanthionine synthetase C family protein [Cytobacillus citreus]
MLKSDQCRILSQNEQYEVTRLIDKLKMIYRSPEKVRDFYDEQGFSDFDLCNLAVGYPGICILTAELDDIYPHEGWGLVGHEYMSYLQNLVNDGNVYSSSLWNGLSGIATAANILSKDRKKYANVTKVLNNYIIADLDTLLDKANANLGGQVDMYDYDVIEGLTGIGRYLIQLDDSESRKATIKAVRYLVSLTNDILCDNHIVHGWYISQENQFLENEKNMYPKGNFNLGLSHGIAGPLSFLSSAYSSGIIIEGQKEAIEKIVSFYKTWAQKDQYGMVWPDRVKFEEFVSREKDDIPVNNESWCYGIPGISHSLMLAAGALEDASLMKYSIDAFEEIFSRPESIWSIKSPTFCHGYAGLLYITQKFYLNNPNSQLEGFRTKLIKYILNQYNEELPFGFLDYDHRGGAQNPGLLLGTAGILLVLISLLKNETAEWDSIFLLS